tara:strand:+ start:63 stop:1163 length:1101 start_codon:yes stop_codon:yes gene_type:complete
MTNIIYKGIKARGDSIQIRLEHNGKTYNKSLKIRPTPKNLKHADALRSIWRNDLAHGIEPDGFEDNTTLTQHYLDSHLERVRLEQSRGSYHRAIGYHRQYSEQFGKLKIANVHIGLIRDFCRLEKAGAATIANKMSFLRSALNEAFEDRVIPVNVLKHWSFKKERTGLVEADAIVPFSVEEEDTILNNFKYEQTRNCYELLFWTGLRPSEVIALTWGDIDFESGTIKVRRSMTKYSTEAQQTKTKGSRRDVRMLDRARSSLMAQRKHTLLGNGEVFLNEETNLPWSDSSELRLQWQHALDSGNITYRKPYITRHTYASRMLVSGETPLYVMNQMGHATMDMLYQHYAKWMPDLHEGAGSKMQEMFA